MLTGFPLLLCILASILLIVVLTSRYKFHPFLALVIACFFLGICSGMSFPVLLRSMQEGFGGLMASIGLIVIFGSVIGVFLEKSGGALQIARYIIQLSGKKRTLSAISVIGAVVSVPVFCDSGFILLSGLSDKLSRLSGRHKASLSLALATGLYTTHTLIPPTPGPIAAAGNLNASQHLGMVILLGIIISIPVLLTVQWLSGKLGKQVELVSEENDTSENVNESVPSVFKSLLPLVLPILLIAAGTLAPFLGYEKPWLSFLSAPVTAIFLGALVAMLVLKPKVTEEYTQWFTQAIKVAGPILIITAAGGAFGGVLKATPLAQYVSQWIGNGTASGLTILLIVFMMAAVLKTAQGSSTSAMVITSSLLAPLVPVLGWHTPLEFALAVMAIGGGAMMVSHYNDSYFWVVSQFSGMSSRDTYRTFSLLTVVQGLTVLLCTLLIWFLFV